MASTPYTFSHGEELAHAWSHGAGALLSVIGLTWMLYIAIPTADGWRIAASVVYGTSLILLFLSSTIYHALYASPRKHIYKLLDHCAIYLLIAGTYTPFLLVAMRDSLGWWLFGSIWALATAGVITKLWFRHRYPKLSLAGYLIMGWLVVFAAPQIVDAIGSDGMWWLIAGGLSYTIGAIFYIAQRIRYHHVIWHAFVLTGGICHFMAVVHHVLPVSVIPVVTG